MIQLFCHFIGDYILQMPDMAYYKKEKSLRGYLYCSLHCILYGLPFFIITNYIGVLLIIITHFIIDKYNLVERFIEFKEDMSVNKNSNDIKFFLRIVIDNGLHLMINWTIIYLLIL